MKGAEICEKIVQQVGTVVIGKEQVIRKVMMAALAKGHILLDDIPGVGKTTLALAFSKTLQMDYKRIQFTPDVLASDVTGFYMYKRSEEQFEFHQGAVMTNLFLADEINRTSPKTQSALLQAMEEGKITVDGNTMDLPNPFMVIATQNPVGSAGTHMLPESQMDRFIMCMSMGYPEPEQEILMLKSKQNQVSVDGITPVINKEILCSMQGEVEKIFVHEEMYRYVTELAVYTRNMPELELGLSPRGTIALLRLSKACAYMKGRNYVVPEDVREVFPDVARHRMIRNSLAKAKMISTEKLIEQVLQNVVAGEPKV